MINFDELKLDEGEPLVTGKWNGLLDDVEALPLKVSHDGNVGIGTASPKQKLHVDGDYYGRGHLWLHSYEGDGQSGTAYLQGRDDSGNSDINLQLRTQKSGKHVNVMRLDSSGNVGIGTTAPESRLDVRGPLIIDMGNLAYIYTGRGTQELNRFLGLLNSPDKRSASGLKAGGILVSDTYAYANPGKNDLIVKGNVGIGTAAPVVYSKLDVDGGYIVMRQGASNSRAKTMLAKLPNETLIIGGPSTDVVYFYWKGKDGKLYRHVLTGRTDW